MKVINGIEVTCCAECPRMNWPKNLPGKFTCILNGREIISEDNLDVPEWCLENVCMRCEFREKHPHSYMPDLCNISGLVGDTSPYCIGKNPCERLKRYQDLKKGDIDSEGNLIFTFTVQALVSPLQYAEFIGYPEGSPENKLPPFSEWDKEDLEHCICTYASEFSGYHRYFKIIGRRLESVSDTDRKWDE